MSQYCPVCDKWTECLCGHLHLVLCDPHHKLITTSEAYKMYREMQKEFFDSDEARRMRATLVCEPEPVSKRRVARLQHERTRAVSRQPRSIGLPWDT